MTFSSFFARISTKKAKPVLTIGIMKQHIFCIFMIVEGSTDKVLQFIMPLKSIYSKNLGFVEQKMVF